MAGPDGSFENGWAAAAWIFRTSTSDIELSNSNVVPGTYADESAYRAELYGILCTIRSAKRVCRAFQITLGRLTLGCDCTSALNSCFAPWAYPKPRMPHFDLLSSIRHEYSNAPFTIEPRYVIGHQVEKGFELDIWGFMNYKADIMAKARL